MPSESHPLTGEAPSAASPPDPPAQAPATASDRRAPHLAPGTIPADRPARAVVVGAGGMEQWWVSTVAQSPVAELLGIADLDRAAARRSADALPEGHPAVAIGTDGVELAVRLGADLLVDATIPVAHHPITVAALHAGIPVLGEQPVTETLPQALSLTAHAEITGTPFMVSQSRRFFPQVRALRRFVVEQGPPVLTSAFFAMFGRAEGYRRAEPHPVLRDIGIHTVDAARYVLDADPVAVTAVETRPPWSTFDHPATVSCTFEMTDGSLFVHNGSWDIHGLTTLWNADWRFGLRDGSATWDGTSWPVMATEDLVLSRREDPVPEEPDQIAASLAEFVAALHEGRTPMCEVHENVLSLAMIDAASEAAEDGGRVVVDDLLERARVRAVAEERDERARARLASWPTVRSALGGR